MSSECRSASSVEIWNNPVYDETPPSDDEEEVPLFGATPAALNQDTVVILSDDEDQPRKKKSKRVFTEDDDIIILKALVQFTTENGIKTGDIRGKLLQEFHRGVVNNLSSDVITQEQIRNKIRHMYVRFVNSQKSSSTFKTVHDREIFSFGTRLWGDQTEQSNMNECLIPKNGLSDKFLADFEARLTYDQRLIMKYIKGDSKEIGMIRAELLVKTMGLTSKFEQSVVDIVKSETSSELSEKKVLKAYMLAKIELSQLVSDAYVKFTKVTDSLEQRQGTEEGRDVL